MRVAPERYRLPAVLLHWAMAVLLLGLVLLGWYMSGLPFSPQRLKLYQWHKWAGITALALACVRLVWRLVQAPPPLPATLVQAIPAWQHMAQRAVHAALYGLFFVVPLLGWAYNSATGLPLVLFGLFHLPDLVPVDKTLATQLKQLHQLAAYALVGLVLLHVGAALKHHFVDRDGLLGRMWFGCR